MERFTIAARSASLKDWRSPTPSMATARKASRCSAIDTRRPLARRSSVNSTIFASMRGARPSVEQVLVVPLLRPAARALRLQKGLELVLRLADIALVLEDGAQRVVDQRLVEPLGVEQGQRLGPVEGLADARRLLQVELADALDGLHHLGRQGLGDAGHLQAYDLQLLLAPREVDVEVQAAALERIGHLACVVAGEHDDRDVGGAQRAELRHADREVA